MKDISFFIEKGRVRGYEETISIDGEPHLFQCAVKKENARYYSYLFSIPESKIDMFEDYAEEEIKTFSSLEDALKYMQTKNVDIGKLGAIKRTLPF